MASLTRIVLRPALAAKAGFRPSIPQLRNSIKVGHRSAHGQATEYLQMNDLDLTDSQRTVREAIAKICQKFPDEYWKKLDDDGTFSLDLHSALAKDGWLGICMPAQYGGAELGISEATIMMQTLSESGGGLTAASSVHMNIFGLEPVVKFGTQEQKDRWLPPLIAGKERACFGVTEPDTGLDTLKLKSLATKNPHSDSYTLRGSKIWTSTAQTAEKILILVRTTPLEEVKKPTEGLSLFYTDLDRSAVEVTEIKKLGRAAVDSNMLMFDGWKVPKADLVGAEGNGFKMIMQGMNAERLLLGGEAIGLGFAGLRRAANYANERHVFGRAIGKNQGIQHPLAESWMKLEAARLLLYQGAKL
jgi:alkylation response protein AidB-like acyl-CoA dehydrogenase